MGGTDYSRPDAQGEGGQGDKCKLSLPFQYLTVVAKVGVSSISLPAIPITNSIISLLYNILSSCLTGRRHTGVGVACGASSPLADNAVVARGGESVFVARLGLVE